jgi:PAS domain S-box-containing protein
MRQVAFDPLAATSTDLDVTGTAPAADAITDLADFAAEPTVRAALESVRQLLGMEVAYVSEIVGEKMVFRDLQGDGDSFGITGDLELPLEQTYCKRMLDGRIPNLIPDASADDRVASLPATRAANIGAFATVPLTRNDGSLYGTLCAASHNARRLDYRGLQFLKVFARVIADQLELEGTVREVRQLAALVDAADDAIIGVTPAGIVTSWNPACERIYGYSAEDAIGHRIVELIALPGQEDGILRTLATLAAGGEAVRQQSRRRTQDEGTIDVAVTLSPIRDALGDVTHLGGGARHLRTGAPRSLSRSRAKCDQRPSRSERRCTGGARHAPGHRRGPAL